MRTFSLNVLALVVFMILGCLYIYCSPFTVQSGDTGELVTNSYFLRVSHPPGYPLWTLLYHVPVKYLSFGNPFASASILTSLFGLISLVILYFSFPSLSTLLVVSILGTTTVVWRYFLLPDVFALHVVFLSLLYLVFNKSELLNKWWMIFLISLSVAHHHTIVFCFPIFVYALIKSNVDRKKIFFCILFGTISLSLYLLLLIFHPEDYGSWGNLRTIQDVANHFLRKEYGTLSLAEKSLKPHSWFGFFSRHIAEDLWSLLLLALYLGITHLKDILKNIKPCFVIFICLFLYLLVFETKAKVSFNLYGESVFERFLITPILLFTFLILHLKNNILLKLKNWMILMMLINISFNIWKNFDQHNYKNKTGIHDLSTNSLKSIPSKSIIFADGDTFGFSSYYLHELLKVRSDIFLIHPSWDFSWSSHKAKKKYPEIFKKEIRSQFILNSINEKYDFYTNQIFPILHDSMVVSYRGILFHYSLMDDKFEQYRCKDDYKFLVKPKLVNFKNFEENSYFDFAYGGCHFQLGLDYIKTNNLQLAEQAFKNSLKLSPFSAKYQERLCFVLKQLNSPELSLCEKNLDLLIEKTNSQYYLGTYEF